ncbi:MAG: hypothetical protein AAF907_03855, partial [Planctomycetota bacterium]
MPDALADPLRFKFQFLNEQGQPQGLFRKKGSWDGQTLALDDLELPAAALVDVQVRDKRMFLAIPAPTDDDEFDEKPAGGGLQI